MINVTVVNFRRGPQRVQFHAHQIGLGRRGLQSIYLVQQFHGDDWHSRDGHRSGENIRFG